MGGWVTSPTSPFSTSDRYSAPRLWPRYGRTIGKLVNVYIRAVPTGWEGG